MIEASYKIIFGFVIFEMSHPRNRSLKEFVVRGANVIPYFHFSSNRNGKELGPLPLTHVSSRFDKHLAISTFCSQQISNNNLLSIISNSTLEVHSDDISQTVALRASSQGPQGVTPELIKYLREASRLGEVAAAWLERRVTIIESENVFLDYCLSSNGFLFLNGWIPNFSELEIYFFGEDCENLASRDEAIAHRRLDVSDFIKQRGLPGAVTDSHGFSIAINHSKIEKKVIVAVLKNSYLHILYNGQPTLSNDSSRIYPLVLSAWRTERTTSLSKALKILRPFIAGKKLRPSSTRLISYSADVKPQVSIIVPFYKEWRFIFSIIAMSEKFGSGYEWVIVSDDPQITPNLYERIALLPKDVAERFTLVGLRRNVGYGTANNTGVEAALSETVLLMNSDIWVEDPRVIRSAVNVINKQEYQLLGFSLLFEDETIQHDGLKFARSGDYENLYLALHPGKGLPPTFENGVVATGAVTGALMMVKKDRFIDIKGFSDDYIGGDFEDADLCLRVLASGGKIGLFRSRKIKHLERQSIKRDDVENFSFARTMTNCVLFNSKWSEILDRQH